MLLEGSAALRLEGTGACVQPLWDIYISYFIPKVLFPLTLCGMGLILYTLYFIAQVLVITLCGMGAGLAAFFGQPIGGYKV